MLDLRPAPQADPVVIRRRLPADATISTWTARDGWPLRRFDWPARSPRGRLLFLAGRSDVFEKYVEAISHLHAQGWSVTSFDWRGQGGSGRLSANPRVGHCADFAPLVDDLADFWRDWSVPGEGPRAVVAHSMGAYMLMRALVDGRVDPAAAVLVAPMLGVRGPLGSRWSGRVARFMAGRGDPARAAWNPSEHPRAVARRRRLLTHDTSRFQDERWWYDDQPDLRLGPPSWGWIAEAFAATARLREDPALEAVTTPVQMLVATHDRLVDARAALAVAARLPDCTVERFGAECAHEILREADGVRDRAHAAIDGFLNAHVPG